MPRVTWSAAAQAAGNVRAWRVRPCSRGGRNDPIGHERMYRYMTLEVESQLSSLVALFDQDAAAHPKKRPGLEGEVKDAAQADELLNVTYNQCLELIPEAGLKRFKETQGAWIQFRDFYCQLASAIQGAAPYDGNLDYAKSSATSFLHTNPSRLGAPPTNGREWNQ